MTTKSRYQVISKKRGIFITGAGRTPVSIRFHPYSMQVLYNQEPLHSFHFFNFRKLVRSIVNGLMQNWEPTEDRPKPTWDIYSWAKKQTIRAVGPKLYPHWRSQLERINPTVISVQRAVFSATCGAYAELLSQPSLYGCNMLVRDITSHRAAAIAVAYWKSLMFSEHDRFFSPDSNLALNEVMDTLREWPNLYAVGRKTYRSLNRTLMNLPGNVPFWLLIQLQHIRLERPITKRLEMFATLSGRSSNNNWRIFHHATEKQIRRSVGLVGQFLERKLSLRRSRDLCCALDFIADFPEHHCGNLVGLTRKSIEWHRILPERNTRGILPVYNPEQATAHPPFDLPDSPHIFFLATAGQIQQEARQMGHCVNSYVASAVAGDCFLFHIDYRGNRATAEVNRQGQVVQCSGPRNRENSACRWARRKLQTWGRQFSKHSIVLREHTDIAA